MPSPETPLRTPNRPPRLLTIAGSDSGGGAGIQADLKTFAAHGAYGMSVVTAVTAQSTRAVTGVQELPTDLIRAQMDAVFGDLGVDAVKIGMLGSAEIVRTVAEGLAHWLPRSGGAGPRQHTPPPVVLDPVMVAKSGDSLLAESAVEALVEELLPLATLVTPNLPEAERLTGIEGLGSPAGDPADRQRAAEALALLATDGKRASYPAVLLKGGHAPGETVEDLLRLADGTLHRFRHPRVAGTSNHGTGCTLSSAITARLALGEALPEAVEGAIAYLHGALEAAYPLGAGHGPVDHLYRLFPRGS